MSVASVSVRSSHEEERVTYQYNEEAVRRRAEDTKARLLDDIRRRRGWMRYVDMLTPYYAAIGALSIPLLIWLLDR